jgi:hypothetical protein
MRKYDALLKVIADTTLILKAVLNELPPLQGDFKVASLSRLPRFPGLQNPDRHGQEHDFEIALRR